MLNIKKTTSFLSSLSEESKGQCAAAFVIMLFVCFFYVAASTNNFAWVGVPMLIGLISAAVFAK